MKNTTFCWQLDRHGISCVKSIVLKWYLISFVRKSYLFTYILPVEYRNLAMYLWFCLSFPSIIINDWVASSHRMVATLTSSLMSLCTKALSLITAMTTSAMNVHCYFKTFSQSLKSTWSTAHWRIFWASGVMRVMYGGVVRKLSFESLPKSCRIYMGMYLHVCVCMRPPLCFWRVCSSKWHGALLTWGEGSDSLCIISHG